MTNEDLLIQCDAILSLIHYREKEKITPQTQDEISKILPELRLATNKIASIRRNSG